MGTPASTSKVASDIGAAHAPHAMLGTATPFLPSPQVAVKQPDNTTKLMALEVPGEHVGLGLLPHFTPVPSAASSTSPVSEAPKADTSSGLDSLPTDALLHLLTFLTRQQLAVFEQLSKPMRELVLMHEDRSSPARQPLTGTQGIDRSLWDASSQWYPGELERALEAYGESCARISPDDESRMAQLEALEKKAKQDADALGRQCAKRFGHIGIDLSRPSDVNSADEYDKTGKFMLDAFLDGLVASTFLGSIHLELDARIDETNPILAKLLDGLENGAGETPLPLVCTAKSREAASLSGEYVKALGRIFSSPALLPWEADLYLADKGALLMPALANARSLTGMALRLECGDAIDSLPLKGHEDCWPNLRSLALQSNDRDLPLQAMDWTAFMKAHPELRKISLASVQAPLAQLLRATLCVNGPLPPETLKGLAGALAATNSLHELWVTSDNIPDPSELLHGLAQNKSIQALYINITTGDAKAWAEMIRGLKAHPCLTMLTLRIAPGDKDIEAACAELRMAKQEMVIIFAESQTHPD